tara:strand:- start:120 stop:326 length:207 start_codon:yes stop_codon:yes gene_type:complete
MMTPADKHRFWTNKLDKLATLANAKEYAQSGDLRYVFCCDLLEVSVDGFTTEQWVNALEDRFDAINGV